MKCVCKIFQRTFTHTKFIDISARGLNPATPGYLLCDVLHCQSMDWERVKRILVTKISQLFKLITACGEWIVENTREHDFCQSQVQVRMPLSNQVLKEGFELKKSIPTKIRNTVNTPSLCTDTWHDPLMVSQNKHRDKISNTFCLLSNSLVIILCLNFQTMCMWLECSGDITCERTVQETDCNLLSRTSEVLAEEVLLPNFDIFFRKKLHVSWAWPSGLQA